MTTDPYANATVEELLTEALDAWRGLSDMVHSDRCAHAGGVEVCDPGLPQAEQRAAQLGVRVIR